MNEVTPQSFFEPSPEWTRKLAKNIEGKTSLPHLRKEISLRLWRILGTLAHQKAREKTARYPIYTFTDNKFEPYIKENIEEALPRSAKRLIPALGKEFAAWLKDRGGAVSFPKGNAIELLRLERHGVDMILVLPLFTFGKQAKDQGSKDSESPTAKDG